MLRLAILPALGLLILGAGAFTYYRNEDAGVALGWVGLVVLAVGVLLLVIYGLVRFAKWAAQDRP